MPAGCCQQQEPWAGSGEQGSAIHSSGQVTHWTPRLALSPATFHSFSSVQIPVSSSLFFEEQKCLASDSVQMVHFPLLGNPAYLRQSWNGLRWEIDMTAQFAAPSWVTGSGQSGSELRFVFRASGLCFEAYNVCYMTSWS